MFDGLLYLFLCKHMKIYFFFLPNQILIDCYNFGSNMKESCNDIHFMFDSTGNIIRNTHVSIVWIHGVK